MYVKIPSLEIDRQTKHTAYTSEIIQNLSE